MCVTEVGCSWGGDARPSYFNLLNLELDEECSRTLSITAGATCTSGRNRGAAVEADTIGEQQWKRTQSGLAAAEADASLAVSSS